MIFISTKICSKCNKEKDIFEFYHKAKSKDGYDTICKQCSIEYQRNRTKRYEPITKGEKQCIICGKIKPVTEFLIDRRLKDGRTNRCKQCNADKNANIVDLNKNNVRVNLVDV